MAVRKDSSLAEKMVVMMVLLRVALMAHLKESLMVYEKVVVKVGWMGVVMELPTAAMMEKCLAGKLELWMVEWKVEYEAGLSVYATAETTVS